MKRIMIFLLLGILFASLAWAEGFTTARDVIEKSYEFYRQGAEVEFEKLRLEVKYEDGYSVNKELERWIKYNPKKEDKVFINFTAPEMDKGLKLLVHRRLSQSDLIWLKMPSMHRSRRISGQDEGKYFAETDLTYRDTAQLVGENTSDYKYSFVDSGDSKWVIEALPKPGITAVYDKRVFFLNENYVIEKVLYYRHGQLGKIQLNKDIVREDNGCWRSDSVVFINEFYSRVTNIKIPERKFTGFTNPPSFSRRDLRR